MRCMNNEHNLPCLLAKLACQPIVANAQFPETTQICRIWNKALARVVEQGKFVKCGLDVHLLG